MKVVLWAVVEAQRILGELQRQADWEVVAATSVAEVARGLEDGAEVLVISDSCVTAELAAALRTSGRRLRFIQALTAGTDRLQRHGTPHGVLVANAGPTYAPAVAAHAVGLLLALQRRVPAALVAQGERRWDPGAATGATIPFGQRGVVLGFGAIGQEIARLLIAFGMHVVGVSRSGASSPVAQTLPLARLDEALEGADALVLAAPLAAETIGILSAARLARCKRGMMLVNIGRGGLVDQAALAAALQDGRLGGAGLDVTDPEPLPADDPLWAAPNLIITPHVAGRAVDVTIGRLCEVVVANLLCVAGGERPLHVVMGDPA